jgi:hypothetical protein
MTSMAASRIRWYLSDVPLADREAACEGRLAMREL